MTTNPNYRLSLQAFPQSWDGTQITLRILVMPQGDPTSALLTGVAPAPDSPAFADANLSFVAALIPSLDALPAPAAVTAQIPLTITPPTGARGLFQQLAAQFNIAPDPPGKPPRRVGYSVQKFLPESYRNAFDFDRPRTPFALTNDSYSCLLKTLPINTPQPPPPSTVSWGRVIGFTMRQPLLAKALGLLYETTVVLPDPTTFANGGWLYVGLAPSSDFQPQLAVNPSLLQLYAARIPPLTSTPRPLFAAVLFPVSSMPPTGSYDGAFTEAEDYDDGFVKIVHGAQPDRAAMYDSSSNGLPPSGDFGMQLGWDDEQITIWYNQQMDSTAVDAPFAVAGYRIDVRAHGNTAWNSMCQVTASLALGSTELGTFQGELSVESMPVRLDPSQPQDWWLPPYFSHWRGGSIVLPDPLAAQLHGTPAVPQQYTAVAADAVPLLYGRSYDVRVRLTDLSRGGPAVTDEAINPGPAPIATLPFRRYVPFKNVLTPDLDLTTTPSNPQTSYQIGRPLLNYPAVAYAGVANVAAALVADLPNAQAQGREAGLPDPDAALLSIEVQVMQLAGDAAQLVSDQDPSPFALLYTTTRAFPTDPTASLELDIAFQDIPDITSLPPQPDTGPLLLPRFRNIRLVLRAAATADPQLLYWGSTDAMFGQAVEILTGANPTDERSLFAPDIEANLIRGILLQPDPVQTSNVTAALAVAGQGGTTAYDLSQRLAQALGLNFTGLTYSGQPGQRVVFGCSSALRHSLSPEHGALTFGAKSELTQHWLIVITVQLARDWTWGVLNPIRFDIRDSSNTVVGSINMTDAVGISALANPDRSNASLVFFDAVDYKPAAGSFPAELNLTYQIEPVFAVTPALLDAPLSLPLTLPIAAPPTQTPQLASAGLALSPYDAQPDYSATAPRQRALWLEFTEPVADPDDIYFARVLAYAPDQLLTGAPFIDPGGVEPPPEPALPIDPELTRLIVPGQSDDHAGLGAMQPLIPSSSPLHYMLPIPTGLALDAPELFGMFVYELRAGHSKNWSTAQGRFGPPLRVAGVQHPAPVLLPVVNSQPATVAVSAPFATPVFTGRNLLPSPPRSQLWALLYAQVTQADGQAQRNVLLDRLRLRRQDKLSDLAPVTANGLAAVTWQRALIETILVSLALPPTSPLSLVVVETLPDLGELEDPLGGDLGHVRILRTSPLVVIPAIC
ncbi:hypothetical protein [Rhodanobacter sp. A1T4]|uniref:hypothetical protein n=1 Tax=Rhodanobacter sp. A1T4 TaxID=2723087 RepID=UPI00161A1114|nr:hypothetical protein [Rhodanobacter sp. A1T4]MBB6249400.1 hypothetical protein [Rhodanobacter sp. A1T4]